MLDKQLSSEINQVQSKLQKVESQLEREAIFAKEANERFEKNLECFNHFYPEIYSEIVGYNPRVDFCLHVTKSGHGNFVPQNQKFPLYDEIDPIAQVKTQVDKQIKSPVFSKTDYARSKSQNADDERLHVKYMQKLGNYLHELKSENDCPLKELPESFPSCVVFGIGLGYHLPILFTHTDFDYIYVTEPDFEQFYASLFCIDWYEIIKDIDKKGGCLFLLLGSDEDDFIKDMERISEDIGAYSIVRSFYYQHTPGVKVNKLIKELVNGYFRFQQGFGFYNDAITGLAHTIKHIESSQPFTIEPLAHNLYEDRPVFIVGNGPSLDEAEEYLLKNCKNAIVIACGTSIKTLHELGITPDFHALIERPYSNYKIFSEIVPREFTKKVNLLSVNMVYPDTILNYAWSGLTWKGNEAGTHYGAALHYLNKKEGVVALPFSNPQVSNTALTFATFFGFKNIYIFGVDNGHTPEGQSHSKHSVYEKGINGVKMGRLATGSHRLEGNFGSYVLSDDLYRIAHFQLEKLIASHKDKTFFNVGSGAKIKGAHPLRVENLLELGDFDDKQQCINHIKDNFFSQLGYNKINEELVGCDELDDICTHLINLAEKDVESVKEASENLKSQSRVVYAYRNTSLGHLYHIVKGALLYYHCPLITLLYDYQDEQVALEKFRVANKLWIGYLRGISEDYRVNYRTLCDLGKD